MIFVWNVYSWRKTLLERIYNDDFIKSWNHVEFLSVWVVCIETLKQLLAVHVQHMSWLQHNALRLED